MGGGGSVGDGTLNQTGGPIEAGGRTTDPAVPTKDTTRSMDASSWERFELAGYPLPGESQGGIYDSDKSNIISGGGMNDAAWQRFQRESSLTRSDPSQG